MQKPLAMDNPVLFLTLLGLTSLLALGPSVTFTTPQPDGVKDLPEFPGRLGGRYFSTQDSSTLLIKAQLVQRANSA